MKRYSHLKVLVSFLLLVLSIQVISSFNVKWDLTSDKRYTLNPLAKDMIRMSSDQIVITVLLEGENIPSSFRNFRAYLDYYVSELRRYNRNVEVIYKDPLEGSSEEVSSFRKFLASQGVQPLTRQATSESVVVYPYLSIHNSAQIEFVDLFEQQLLGENEDERLVRSQLTFEGKFLRAIRQLNQANKPLVHILGYKPTLLAEGYNRDPRMNAYRYVASDAKRLLSDKDSVSAIIVVAKETDLLRSELLAIDVVGGSGVPVFWMVDKFDITLDSLRSTGEHLAIAKEYQFEDYLFRLGVKVKPELILDFQSTSIPQRVDDGRSNGEIKMFKYPYHPFIFTNLNNPPITSLSSPLPLYYSSPLELSDFPKQIIKEQILTSSKNTRNQSSPAMVNFGIMRNELDISEYQGGNQVLGVRVTGRCTPYFKNRLLQEDIDLLDEVNVPYILDSQYIDQVILSDADFALPVKNPQGGYIPIGYNLADRQMYDATAQLISNVLESTIFNDDLLVLSRKTSTIALLNKEKYGHNVTYYGFLLLCIPIGLLVLGYGLYHGLRKRRYAG